jgi:hypothetical protein
MTEHRSGIFRARWGNVRMPLRTADALRFGLWRTWRPDEVAACLQRAVQPRFPLKLLHSDFGVRH